MANINFEFEGNFYTATSTFFNNNGKISCDIKRILNQKSDQEATFSGFHLGVFQCSDLPVSKAISAALNEYLKNNPVAHFQ